MSFVLILKNEEKFAKQYCSEAMSEQVNYEWLNVDSPLLGSTDHRIYWLSVYNFVLNINPLEPASATQISSWMPF